MTKFETSKNASGQSVTTASKELREEPTEEELRQELTDEELRKKDPQWVEDYLISRLLLPIAFKEQMSFEEICKRSRKIFPNLDETMKATEERLRGASLLFQATRNE
ncbi:MAG: hypothetical protein AAB965_01740 [Patescibacteria group bacterium]